MVRVTKRWTVEEENFLSENYGKMTCQKIGEVLGRSVGSVRKHLPCLGLSRSRNKYKFNDTYFSVIDTPEKAYWFGFISADGCIIDTNSNGSSHKRVKIALQRSDDEHLRKFRSCIQGNQPVTYHEVISKAKNIYSTECQIVIYSARMVRDLEQLGLYPRKTYSLPFPDSTHLDDELMPHYLRGFIDADGSFTSRTRGATQRRVAEFSIVGADRAFLMNAKNFLENSLGVKIGLYKKRKGNWRIVTSAIGDVQKILDYIYKADGITYNSVLNRKYLKYIHVKKDFAVCVGDDADNKPGKNWKPKLNLSMVIRAEERSNTNTRRA